MLILLWLSLGFIFGSIFAALIAFVIMEERKNE